MVIILTQEEWDGEKLATNVVVKPLAFVDVVIINLGNGRFDVVRNKLPNGKTGAINSRQVEYLIAQDNSWR